MITRGTCRDSPARSVPTAATELGHRRLLASLLALAAVAGSCQCRGRGGPAAPGPCAVEWPSWSGPGEARPGLAGEAGKVLARQRLPREPRGPRLKWGEGLALSRGRVALTWGSALFLTDLNATAPAQAFAHDAGHYLSAPAADGEGRLYVSSYRDAIGLGHGGGARWSARLGAPRATGEFPELLIPVRPFAVAPDGRVYLASSDRRVRAWDSEGKALWEVAIPGEAPVGAPAVAAGAGNVLMVHEQGSTVGMYDVRDGRRTGPALRTEGGQDLGIVDDNWTVGYDWGITLGWFPFEPCGRGRPPLAATSTIRRLPLTTTGDLLVETASSADERGNRTSPDALYLWSRDGARRAGPAAVPGVPAAAGADGALYTLVCDEAGGAAVQAADRELRPTWKVELGGDCPAGNVLLTGDGVLWLLHRTREGDGEVVAIQTSSPGLAHSSWPSRRHDNAGTSWLSEGRR